jgi:sulfite reductase (NADPH) flavoprotein alpha-component
MFRYFGYGSNLSITSLRAKGVEPCSTRVARLQGWRLRFNVQHFFRHEGGVGNIEFTDNAQDSVLGILYDCPDDALQALDDAEAFGHGYDRISVDVESGTEICSALTYIGMADFIDEGCLPCRRYLNILVQGAQQAGLDEAYIQALSQQPIHIPQAYPEFTAPPGQFPTFNTTSLAKHPQYTALYGAVFDMSNARPLHTFLKGFFGGRDMTLFHIKRLDCSDGTESMDDIRQGRLNQAQMSYINSYLNEYAREYRYVGRFDYNED